MRSNLDVIPIMRKRTKIVRDGESTETLDTKKRIDLPPIVNKPENAFQT
jgi:hypothetical protein